MSHRILIVRLGAIGDVVVTTTLFHGLRAAWPDAHIGWLVDARLAGMLAGLDGLDRVHQWDRVGWSGALRSGRIDRLAQGIAALRRDLRREGYTMVLDAQGLLKSSGLGLLAGAGERWALRPREGSALLAHHVVPAAERRLPGDEYRDLLRALGVPGAESARMALPIAPDRGAEARALIAQRIGEGGFVALCPFTTRPQKHWFDERWSELTRSFLGRGLHCVIMGGPSDRERAEAIRSSSAPGTISLAGEARLEVSASVLAHARLTIGVDTGLTHWSMAHRTPTIALMGSALPYTVALEGSTVLREPMACAPCDRRPTCAGRFECMRALTVKRVMAAAVSLLERPSPT
jgi:heptosyltransferase-1